MLSSVLALVALPALALAQATQDAPVVDGNPEGVQLIATFPDSNTSAVRGSFVAETPPDRRGVRFGISVSGLPEVGGPFIYHIHDQPVPLSGNCTATLAHLDPYVRGEEPPCDATQPQSCQTGDLSGKHGGVEAVTSFSANYLDQYLSLQPATPSYLGNRSVVIHFANKTRITCANFYPYNTGANTTAPYNNGTGGTGATHTSGTSSSTPSTSASSSGPSGVSASGSATQSGGATQSTGGAAAPGPGNAAFAGLLGIVLYAL